MSKNLKYDVPAACVPPEFLADLLKKEQAIFLGMCAVQAPHGWGRYGAVWYVKNTGQFVCWGLGLNYWNTSEGFAQLVSKADVEPSWHAMGWAVCSRDSFVMAAEPVAVAKYTVPAGMTQLAREWWEAQQ